MTNNIRHIGIVIFDIQKSLEFYEKYLGFTLVKRMEEGGTYLDELLCIKNTKVTTIKLTDKNNQLIELLYFHNPKAKIINNELDNIGLTHFAITVENIDEIYSCLMQQNVEFLSTPHTSPDGYAKVAFCQDPNGVYIELVEVL